MIAIDLPPKIPLLQAPAIVRPIEHKLLRPGYLPIPQHLRRTVLRELVERKIITREQAKFAMFFVPPPFILGESSTPVIAATNVGNLSSPATTFNAPLPSSIAASELLLLIVGTRSGSSPVLNTPSGWTQLKLDTHSATGLRQLGIYYKVASGSEGATQAVTATDLFLASSNAYRITGYSGTPEAGTAATGSSTAPNPPSVTPSWGALNTLWLSICTIDTNNSGLAAPTNYANTINDYSTLVPGPCTASARRALNAVSDDPSAFGFTNSAQWIAQTVAIRPS